MNKKTFNFNTQKPKSEIEEKNNLLQELPILPPIVLVFDACDPTGGGGLVASALTISAVGCYPTTVISALSVQDTVGIAEIHGLSPEIVVRQAQAILEDMPIAAFKVGLVGNADSVRVMGELFEEYDDVPLVYDPCFSSSAGEDLINDEILETLWEDIITQTTIFTPNISEARRLCAFIEQKDFANANADKCAQVLLQSGCEYLLITGTHENTKNIFLHLYHHQNQKILTLETPRINAEFYGAGNTLSSAIAGYMGHGIEIVTAVKLAQEFSWQSLNKSFRLGMGKQIPNRMYWRCEALGLPLNTIGDKILQENKLETSYPGN